jgi:predicted CxxxxCH...CXXCH cytochrome family protein
MSQFFSPPRQSAARLIKQAAQIIHGGGIVAVPTDSCYALVCHLDDKGASSACAASAAWTKNTT